MNYRTALLVGVVSLIAGAVGPWVSMLGIISLGPTANAEISVVVFGGIAVLLLSAVKQQGMRPASIVVGGLALSEAVYALVRIQEVKSDAGEFGALVSPGWGLYLTILAGLYLIASTWISEATMRNKAVTSLEENISTSVPPPVTEKSF